VVAPLGQDAAAWASTFAEEFTGTTLDTTRWDTILASGQTYIPNNNEQQWYDAAGVTVSGGTCKLTATPLVNGTQNYRSGLIQAQKSFGQVSGFIEARMRIPSALGTWSAFWLVPVVEQWPPEIDIVETWGVEAGDRITSTYHYDIGAGAQQVSKETLVAINNWHVYGCQWDANRITVYLDGVQVWTTTTGTADLNVALYPIINLAVSNTTANSPNPADYPQIIEIDYVRAWVPVAKVATLTETFTAQDNVKWTGWGADAYLSSGRLGLNATPAYPRLLASGAWDLTASSILYELVQPPNVGAGSTQVFAELTLDVNNKIQFLWENNNVIPRAIIAGAASDGTPVAYNATSHRWWRISESGGTITWATSPDAVTWTTRRTLAAPFALTALTVGFYAGYWGTETAPGSALIDNVNTAPGSSSFTASAALSGSGTLTATAARVPLGSGETFEGFATGTWAEQSIHGKWLVEFVSGGTAQIIAGTGTNTSKVLRIESAVPTGTQTFSALVTSDQSRSGDIDFTVDMRTLAQLRATSPAAWEAAWLCWNFKRLSATTVRYYYVTLKPGVAGTSGGFELGKVDQSVFTGTGGQRFLWTDTSTVYPVGATWHTVRVQQTGARIRVTVDGALKADFTDGAGSGGTPAWGTAGESVFTDGGVGLYEEDARAEFDNITLASFSASAALTGSGTLTATAVTPKPTTSAGLSGSGTLTAAVSASSTYRMYASASPPTVAAADSSAVNVAVEFYVTSAATLTRILWWQPTTNASTVTRVAALYRVSDQAQVATIPATAPVGTGWQTMTFSSPVTLTANTRYRAVVFHSGGQYPNTASYYASGADEVNGPLVIPKSANATANQQGSFIYGTGLTYPTGTFNSGTYWVDVTVATTGASAATATAALTGSGALDATATGSTRTTTAAFTGSGTLSATATASTGGAATSSGVLHPRDGSRLRAGMTLRGGATVTPGVASAALNGSGALSVTMTATRTAAAALSGVGALGAALSGTGVLAPVQVYVVVSGAWQAATVARL
jgi:beta-glucanase (GH16 family)